jgi:hypothetical protein
MAQRISRSVTEVFEALDEIEASPLAARCLNLVWCRQELKAILASGDRPGVFMPSGWFLPTIEMGIFLAQVDRGAGPRAGGVPCRD